MFNRNRRWLTYMEAIDYLKEAGIITSSIEVGMPQHGRYIVVGGDIIEFTNGKIDLRELNKTISFLSK